jgi:hypothetical protein
LNRQELHKKIRHFVNQLTHEKGFVSPLELFIKLEKVSPKLVEEWRFGSKEDLINFLLSLAKETDEIAQRIELKFADHNDEDELQQSKKLFSYGTIQ